MSFPRASNKELLVLELLRSGREMYGLELVHSSAGKLKRGTIYVTLGRMVEKNYLEFRVEHDDTQSGMPRRKYKISALGSRVFDSAQLIGLNSLGGVIGV